MLLKSSSIFPCLVDLVTIGHRVHVANGDSRFDYQTVDLRRTYSTLTVPYAK
jgi:hypothetical protein